MLRKNKNIIVIFFTLSLIISNMASGIYSFAEAKNINQLFEVSTIKRVSKDNTNCKPDKVTGLRIELKNSTSMKLIWKRVRRADGYIIYRSTVKNGIYKKIAKTSSKTSAYLEENLEPGTNYYYKIRAYANVDDKIYCGCYSDILEATTCPDIVTDLHTSCISNCDIRIEWDRVCHASGYEVFRTTSSTGSYSSIAIITDGSKPFYTDENLKDGKKYYYKVRAFKEINGKLCFGDCSKVLSTCTKK